MIRGIVVLAVLVVSQSAFAQTVTVKAYRSFHACNLPVTTKSETDSHRYEINRELGRSRLQIRFSPQCTMGEDSVGFVDMPVQISGLSYDDVTSQIVFTGENGARVVCANVEFSSRRLRLGTRTRIRPTGACKVTVRTESEPYDNGFEIQQYEIVTVDFET